MRGWRTVIGAALLLLTAPAVQAQQPAPQYSVDDIVGTFDCASGTVGPDGKCGAAPRSTAKTRSFSLARPGSRPAAAAVPLKRRTRDLLITFANNAAELTPQAKANARVFADALNTPRLAAVRFAIDGHTNAVGSAASNLDLSRRRAAALADELVADGVKRSRLEVNGYGFRRPLNPRNPRAAENRRVEARRLN